MKNYKIRVCVKLVCVFISSLGFIKTSSADEIKIVADLWCPFICHPSSNSPGSLVEITKTIFEEKGHKVIFKNIPWRVATHQTYEGVYNAVVGGTYNNLKKFSPNLVFPDVEQGIMKKCFFVLKDNPWEYTGLESLKGQRIGVIDDYAYPAIQKFIDENPFLIKSIPGDNALPRNMDRLLSGYLITTIIEDESVFNYVANQTGNKEKFRQAGCDGSPPEENKVYISFTPKEINPKSAEYAKILTEGMTTIRKNGKLAKILEKYGMKDWK